MLMTGRYNIRYGLQTQVVPNNKAYGLPLSEVTVADRLKALGYQTHAVGKWVRATDALSLSLSLSPSPSPSPLPNLNITFALALH